VEIIMGETVYFCVSCNSEFTPAVEFKTSYRDTEGKYHDKVHVDMVETGTKKILLIDIDSTIPNLALKKVEKFYLDRGDEVIWNLPLFKFSVDKIYVSCIFTENRHKCCEWEGSAVIGGTGYDLKVKLPDEIEAVKPRINFGFTTRGCVRQCKFCFVPEKEGKIHVVGDIYDIWDGKSKELVIMDNNILALPKHFKIICGQIRKEKLKVDFNQGLDIRLLNDELAQELATIKHISDIRFAWDNLDTEAQVRRGIECLKRNHCKRAMFYVLCGFNSTIEDDLYRFNTLKELGQRAYCMRFKTVKGKPEYNDLSAWVNQPRFYESMTFERFKECRRNRKLLKEDLTVDIAEEGGE
jgi:hypothetical protein